MKTTFALMIAFFLVIPFIGKTQDSQNGPQPTKEPTVYKGVTDNACAVEMAFGSPGSGIDGKAFEKAIAEIESRKLKYTTKNIGREGETRICLPLTEIKGCKKKQFINKLKSIAKEGQYVSVSIR